MSGVELVATFVAILLVVYLSLALLRPEWFG